MTSQKPALVILAAGQGTRMRSSLPKVLHPLCGRPMLLHSVALARELGAERVIVVAGTGSEPIEAALAGWDVEFCSQREPLGTAHAALQARSALADHEGPVVVTNGDHPLYRTETFRELLERFRAEPCELALLTAELPDPGGYGRIVRDGEGQVQSIVEERDADAGVRGIREVNLGAYVATADHLFNALGKVGNDNAKGEYYLTDLVEITRRTGGRVAALEVGDAGEAMGVNDRVQLAEAERVLRRRINRGWLERGVTLVDPDHTYIDVDCEIGPDSVLAPGVQLKLGTRLGPDCRIDAGVVIESSQVESGCWIKPHCWVEQSRIGPDCIVGPSAHLRPDAELGAGCRVGNYVEIKNSRLGAGTKADHLSYIGDADVGAGVTFACGAVTVNYDGRDKHRTVIGDAAFVGCNANLIAPVTIEPRAFVAAGSTITASVPPGALAVERARQRNIEGWRERKFGPET